MGLGTRGRSEAGVIVGAVAVAGGGGSPALSDSPFFGRREQKGQSCVEGEAGGGHFGAGKGGSRGGGEGAGREPGEVAAAGWLCL